MSTRQYSNYADLITFSRSSGGTALRPISYGPELVTNGTFDTDSDWTKGTGWTISGGVASFASSGVDTIRQDAGLVTGTLYSITYTVSNRTAGTIKAVAGGDVSGAVRNANGTYTEYLVSGTNAVIYMQPDASFDGSIDNISVREVLFDQAGAPLTLFNHPANTPRIEYNAAGERLGLLVEEARTNLLTYSEDFSNAYWSKLGASVTSDSIASPDGTTTADKLVETSSSGLHDVRKDRGSNFIGTFSCYLKAAERTKARLMSQDAGYEVSVDLASGTITGTGSAVDGATITGVGNGWYRVTLVETSGISLRFVIISIRNEAGDSSYTGDGTSGIYIWGAQLEAGAFPTSYIPTSGATATRAADVCSMPVSAFGYNQAEGTVVVSVGTHAGATSGSQYVVSLDNSSVAERMQINRFNGNYVFDVVDNSVSQVSSSVGAGVNGSKVSFAYALNDFAATENGDTPITDAVGSVPAPSKISIGLAYNSTAQLNGHIKSVQYIPRRLTNAQLQELTS